MTGTGFENVDVSKLRELCLLSIEPAVRRLCEAGSWPRPPRARLIRIGHDYYGDDLRGIKEVSALTKFLRDQEALRAMYLDEPEQKYVLEEFWRRLLVNILAETDGNKVKIEVFNKWFQRFIKELFTDASTWRAIDVIDGLILNAKEVQLDEYTSLMSIPRYWSWDWLGYLVRKHDNHFNPIEFLDSKWGGAFGTEKVALVVTTMTFRKCEIKPVWAHAPSQIDQIGRTLAAMYAVRLLKNGSPRWTHSSVFHLSLFPLKDAFGYPHRDIYPRIYEKEAILSKSDYPKLKSLWQEAVKGKHQWPIIPNRNVSPIDIAEGRFFRSYETGGWFENILDLTIALEALFSPSDSQEISHRIALRCAWLLGAYAATSTNRNRVYECVRAMYELRSSVVHGGTPGEKKVQKWIGILAGTSYDRTKDWALREQALESAREIVRKSLRACTRLSKLPHGGPHWPLPANFDQCMVEPVEQRKWQKAAGIHTVKLREG
jgi:hypothetical protein